MEPLNAFKTAIVAGILDMAVFTLATLGKLVPLKAPYTYTPGMALADVTVSDFDGSTPIVQSAVPSTYSDPLTDDEIIALTGPAGGFQWVTSGTTNLPQTVYGYALTDAGGTTLLAVTDPLTTPIPLTAVGQGIDAGDVGFRVTLSGLSPLQQS